MPIGAGAYAMKIGQEGDVGSTESSRLIIGTAEGFRNAEGGNLPFGRFVVRDAAGEPGDLILPNTAGQEIIGVTYAIKNVSSRTANTAEGVGYPDGFAVSVVKKVILMFVIPETDLAIGDSLFVRHTDEAVPTALQGRGKVRNDNSGGNADALVVGTYKVARPCLAGEVGAVTIEFPTTS